MSSEDTPAVPIEAFIARVRGGDASAFDEIVRRYDGLVLRVARRLTGNREDALDVSQETFLRVYRSLGRFHTGRRFETWIYRIVVNASWDLIRKRGVQPATLAAEADRRAEEPTAMGWSPHEELERGELRGKLDAILAELTPRERAVFVLRDVEGLPTGEIARVLGCREVTVRRHSMEARERIRKLLSRGLPQIAEKRSMS